MIDVYDHGGPISITIDKIVLPKQSSRKSKIIIRMDNNSTTSGQVPIMV